jgi:predicted enzyme related to lactoylglutathione lyase
MPAPTLVVGAPCWIDLYTSDTAGASEFYGRLFDWNAEPPEEGFGGYFTFTKDGKHVGGCMHNDGQTGVPDVWTVYLMTDDIDAAAEATARHGGQVHLEPMAVAENGRMAMVADSGGASVGVWQPGTQKGFEVRDEIGTPGWFELHTRDYDASVAFYHDVFRWDAHSMSDTPEFRYTTLGEGDDMLAGIMDASAYLPEGIPAHWSIYFRVADADAALEQIVALGGTVVEPAKDTPYGRLAEAADPTGSRFKLVAG